MKGSWGTGVRAAGGPTATPSMELLFLPGKYTCSFLFTGRAEFFFVLGSLASDNLRDQRKLWGYLLLHKTAQHC